MWCGNNARSRSSGSGRWQRERERQRHLPPLLPRCSGHLPPTGMAVPRTLGGTGDNGVTLNTAGSWGVDRPWTLPPSGTIRATTSTTRPEWPPKGGPRPANLLGETTLPASCWPVSVPSTCIVWPAPGRRPLSFPPRCCPSVDGTVSQRRVGLQRGGAANPAGGAPRQRAYHWCLPFPRGNANAAPGGGAARPGEGQTGQDRTNGRHNNEKTNSTVSRSKMYAPQQPCTVQTLLAAHGAGWTWTLVQRNKQWPWCVRLHILLIACRKKPQVSAMFGTRHFLIPLGRTCGAATVLVAGAYRTRLSSSRFAPVGLPAGQPPLAAAAVACWPPSYPPPAAAPPAPPVFFSTSYSFSGRLKCPRVLPPVLSVPLKWDISFY
eukprot:gene23224-biopygen5812